MEVQTAATKATPRQQGFGWVEGLKVAGLAWIVLNHVVEELAGSPYIANPNSTWPPLSERIAQLAPIQGLGVWAIPANFIRYLGWFGDQGVQLFLIASGFGLMWAALHRPWQGWHIYLKRRAFRIYPLWWAAHVALLAGSVALVVIIGKTSIFVSPLDPRFYLSFIGIRFLPSTLYYAVPAWWYIGLALQLYLVFPFMARALRRIGPYRFLLAATVLGTAARLVGLLTFDAYLDAWSRGAIFITRVPEFAFGMTLAALFATDREQIVRQIKRPATLATAVIVYIVATLLSLTLVGNAVSPVLLGVSAFIILFVMFEWLGEREPARWLGGHSYSTYLTHQTFIVTAIQIATVAGLTALLTGVGIVAAIVLAVIAGLLLERSTTLVSRVRHQRGSRWLGTRILIVVAITSFALIGAELAVQRLGPQEVFGWGERPSLVLSDQVGWQLVPSSTTRLRWQGYDYQVTANWLGFAGPEPLPTGQTVRIVTLGDAFTSAEGVDTDDAWPRVVERELGGAAGGYEVVNLAVAGYGPEQYAAVAEHYLYDLAPDVVLIGFFVNEYTDVTRSTEDFQSSIGFGQADPFGLSATLRLSHLRKFVQYKIRDPLVETLKGEPNPLGYLLGNFAVLESDGIDSNQAAAVDEYLKRIVAVADDIGAEARLVLIPAPPQICGPEDLHYYPKGVDVSSDAYDLDAPQRITTAIADSVGVEVTDLRPMLASLPGCPYFDFNMHWKASTHRAVGAYVADLVSDWYPANDT
jgi:peptidoglycan/LPS O-acetylase OafA/YrhL